LGIFFSVTSQNKKIKDFLFDLMWEITLQMIFPEACHPPFPHGMREWLG